MHTRRDALRRTAAVSLLALAGCLSDGPPADGSDDSAGDQSGDGSDDSAGDQSGDGDENGDDRSPTVEETAIETTDADCSSGDDDRASVESDDETVVVEGALGASDPCHEAVLGETEIEDGVLAVTVDVESVLSSGEGCMRCVGVVEYTARIDVTGMVERVRVTHVGGETRELDLS